MPGYLAEALTLTPSVTQGPFYPLATNMPLDDDNDLAFFNPNVTAADGIVSYIYGRVLDSSGNPIKNALVELWHTDNDGNYIYSNSQPRTRPPIRSSRGSANSSPQPAAATSFGRSKLASTQAGPAIFAWVLRSRDNCIAIRRNSSGMKSRSAPTARPWPTQNNNDMVLQGITDPVQRASVTPASSAV